MKLVNSNYIRNNATQNSSTKSEVYDFLELETVVLINNTQVTKQSVTQIITETWHLRQVIRLLSVAATNKIKKCLLESCLGHTEKLRCVIESWF